MSEAVETMAVAKSYKGKHVKKPNLRVSHKVHWSLVCLVVSTIILLSVSLVLASAQSDRPSTELRANLYSFDMPVADMPYEWAWSDADLQLPELPTGCEATAISTMLRMHGIYVSKTQIADAMPRSSTDFVYSFLGNPYNVGGGACMAPCAALTASKLSYPYYPTYRTHMRFNELSEHLPCCVWVTSYLSEPKLTREKDGFGLYKGTHCMVLLEINESNVTVSDPLVGLTTYPKYLFERRFDQLGGQSVWLAH